MNYLESLLYEYKLQKFLEDDVIELKSKFECIDRVYIDELGIAFHYIDLINSIWVMASSKDMCSLTGDTKKAMEWLVTRYIVRIGL